MASDVLVLSATLQICLFLANIIGYNANLKHDEHKYMTRSMYTEENIFFELIMPEVISYSYKVKPAKDFGIALNRTLKNIHLVPAVPLHGCSNLENAPRIKDNIALIRRGECSFVSKTMSAEKAGALAAIITDHDVDNDEKFIDMIQDETTRKVTIPAYFLLGKDGQVIISTLKKLDLPSAVINIPINITGIHLHHLHQPPWRVW